MLSTQLCFMFVDNMATIILQPQTRHLLYSNPSKVLYQARQQRAKSIFQWTFTEVVKSFYHLKFLQSSVMNLKYVSFALAGLF